MTTNVVGNKLIIGIQLNKTLDYYNSNLELLTRCGFFYDVINNGIDNNVVVILSTCMPKIVEIVSLRQLTSWAGMYNHKIIYEK